MQARIALEHGKRLFLVESLVMKQGWARAYASRPGTVVIKSVDDLIRAVRTVVRPAKQLAFR
jgi:DNA processing protein